MAQYVSLFDICTPKQWPTLSLKELSGGKFPVYGANGIIGYHDTYNHEKPTIMIGCRGSCGHVSISDGKAYINGNAMCLDNLSESIIDKYLLYYLEHYDFSHIITGSSQPQITREGLKKVQVPITSKELQAKLVTVLDKVSALIEARRQQGAKLDEVVKARFVELFGDLKTNPFGWKIKSLLEVADIDTVMVNDYEKYANYPHIGIDSIEKNTGKLFGYRTIAEDGVISGKYLFTDKHIIYSKIRPNLNKVAMPDFEGLCSADAYPILPKENICLRIYLGYVMRSEFFLDYILPFSRRANMPKVNKEQLSGFNLPVPPIELQNQFATFVEQTDKSKLAIQQSLDKLETLKKSLMQKYFG